MMASVIDLTRFEKNPVMLFNHHRTCMGRRDEILPIGRWEDLKVEDGVLTGVSVFDGKDEFAVKIRDKVEGGFLCGCSVGIRVREWSERPEDLKPGQQYPTATDLAAGIAWQDGCVSRALGSTDLFDNQGNALVYGDIISAAVRAGGHYMRNDKKGVCLIYQATA